MYPESAPDNWQDVLSELRTPWALSPLHDRCINPDNTPKKHHWHVVLQFEGKKSFEQIKAITDSLNAPIPQKVANMVGVIRYMAHMDNPEKAQYLPSAIKTFGGMDISKFIKPTVTERYACLIEMRQYIKDNHITEFYQLYDYAAEHRYEDWFKLLSDNSAVIMNMYITSQRHTPVQQHHTKQVTDYGEVVVQGATHPPTEEELVKEQKEMREKESAYTFEMQEFITECCVWDYDELLRFAKAYRRVDWYLTLINSKYVQAVIKSYISAELRRADS
jgi:hypothetical protein